MSLKAILNTRSQAIIESCVETTIEALIASKNGADRLELCSSLDQDGLTPGPTLLKETASQVHIPIKVMIRPRAGNFIYDAADKQIIDNHIAYCHELGVKEWVYGSIKSESGRLDMEDIKAFASKVHPETLTIHKAIDRSTDILRDVFDLVKWSKKSGINLSILSSGGAATAIEGAMMLNRMARICGTEVELVVAGKVTHDNLNQIKEAIPAPAYHGRRIVNLTQHTDEGA